MKSETKWRDILALNLWVNWRSRVGWIVSVLVASWVAASVVSNSVRQGESLSREFAMFFITFVAAMAAVWSIGGIAMVLFAIMNVFRKGTLGPKTFTLAADVFLEDDGHRVTAIPWKEIRSIDKTRRHIFVRLSRWKYMLLSARDFEHEHEFAQYYAELLKARYGAMRSAQDR